MHTSLDFWIGKIAEQMAKKVSMLGAILQVADYSPFSIKQLLEQCEKADLINRIF